MLIPMRRLIVLVTSLMLAALVAGCSPEAVASLIPRSGPLVTYTTRGGECFDGPCGSTIVIERDGSVRQAAPTDADLATLQPDVLAPLEALVTTADYAAIRAVPFEGECPVNFDGQDQIYEFGAPGGVERIASSETAIDPDHPLFAATAAALVAAEVIPAN